MDTIMVILLTAVASVGVCTIAFAIINSRKNGNTDIPWDKIRPVLSEMFTEVVTIMQLKDSGYQAVEDYAVAYVKEKIDSADFLVQEEKDLLSAELIRSLISPRLKELYASESITTKRI
jgi:2-phosphoglycerate kinase